MVSMVSVLMLKWSSCGDSNSWNIERAMAMDLMMCHDPEQRSEAPVPRKDQQTSCHAPFGLDGLA